MSIKSKFCENWEAENRLKTTELFQSPLKLNSWNKQILLLFIDTISTRKFMHSAILQCLLSAMVTQLQTCCKSSEYFLSHFTFVDKLSITTTETNDCNLLYP